jgi:hypothetical protein
MAPMRYALVIAVDFGLLVSCVSAHPQSESDQVRGVAQEPAQQYFPVGVFGQDEYKVRWYTSLLAAMKEPSLFETSRKAEITEYRLLMDLNDRALSFRLELLVDGTGELSVARVILHSGKPESVLLNDRVPVSAERAREFLTLLQKADFLNAATEEKDDKLSALDGTHWVLEGVENRKYHVVDRLSSKGTDLVRSCIFLMALTPRSLDEPDEKQAKSHSTPD